MSTHTLTLEEKQIWQLKDRLKQAKECKTPPYAHYQIKTEDCTITAYQSGKVVFQGEGADFYETALQPKQAPKYNYPQCGSDEVGTGDYFGPVVVCACCVEEKHLPLLQSLRIQDSKQLSDKEIETIAPKLMEQLTYSRLILENERYNLVHATNNMNAIKAKMHNQAFLHLANKLNFKMEHIIIDEFTPKTQYYRYIQKEPHIIYNIHFETKAENKYLSVACASIIARYTFLEAMRQMSTQYAFLFPKGAGTHVDEAGRKFVSKHGKEMLHKVSKYHFKNTQRILHTE